MNTDGLETFFTISEQTALFLGSVVLGAFLGAVFDVFRIIRILFPALRGKTAVTLCDILYMLIFGASVFFYSALFGRAEVRFFFAAGAFLGAVLFTFTIGNVVTSAVRSFRSSIIRTFGSIYGSYFKPIADKICSKRRTSAGKFVECDEKGSQ